MHVVVTLRCNLSVCLQMCMLPVNKLMCKVCSNIKIYTMYVVLGLVFTPGSREYSPGAITFAMRTPRVTHNPASILLGYH